MRKLSSVLYVENQPFFADEQLLELEGIPYTMALTAADARNKLLQFKYDAVLLDIMLDPGADDLIPEGVPAFMGGVTVLRKILNDDFHEAGNGRALPVVVYTAVGLREVKEVILRLLGANAKDRYFEKPESFENVLKALKKAVATRSERQ